MPKLVQSLNGCWLSGATYRMNFRNRYLVIVIRTLLGLIRLASGISGLIMGNSTQGVPEQMVAFTQVFWSSGIFQMVKVTEIVAGFMLVFGILPALATLFLAPDVVGIVTVNARLIPSFLWLGGLRDIHPVSNEDVNCGG